MSVTVNGTSGLTFNDASTQNTAATGFGFKNRIINGNMRIDQRNAGASVTMAGSGYTLDRYLIVSSQASKLSVQQNAGAVTPPSGYTNYLGVTSLSAYSLISTDSFSVIQQIEGYNIADFDFGTVNAKIATVSFWVRSSLTGTFGGNISNGTRFYAFSYTIALANTWEQKTITIAGDTTGTWLKTNGAGLILTFGLGQGSTYSGTAGAWTTNATVNVTGAVSVVGTSGATFYITGVQLEKGSTATSYDLRPYGTELALCQRYLPAFVLPTGALFIGSVNATSTTVFNLVIPFSVPARVAPTGILGVSATGITAQVGASSATSTTVVFGPNSNSYAGVLSCTMTGGSVGGGIGYSNQAQTIQFTGCEL